MSAILINLHSRSALTQEAVDAYISIQRRVDALSVVHRNHYAELEVHPGIGVRSLISELSVSLRGSMPEDAPDRKSTRLNSSTNAHIVCRLLFEKKNTSLLPYLTSPFI